MLLYTAFTDESTYAAKQIAQFDPFGNGYCNFTNGDLRYEIQLLINLKIYKKERTPTESSCVTYELHRNLFENYFMFFISRLQLTALEGIEFNSDGSRRRRWNWWAKVNASTEPHVHAPPCQPILFHLNDEIVIKVCSQEKIYMKFSSEIIELKFKVGARLQVKTQRIPRMVFITL
jgi:hypothetical protein